MGKIVSKVYVFLLSPVTDIKDAREFTEVVFGNEPSWDPTHQRITNSLFTEDYSACKWFLRINHGASEHFASFRINLAAATLDAAVHELKGRVEQLAKESKISAQEQLAA